MKIEIDAEDFAELYRGRSAVLQLKQAKMALSVIDNVLKETPSDCPQCVKIGSIIKVWRGTLN